MGNPTRVGDEITFSFGKNWSDFLKDVDEGDITRAQDDIRLWLGKEAIDGKRIIDVGSGSGIHSLAFLLLGAESVHSFDFDPLSVEATRALRSKAKDPASWTVERGSILDDQYVTGLGTFDVVYSWGVLHHTGSMWEAVDNCFGLVAPGGRVWISLYQAGPNYEKHLALKRRFNRASRLGKRWMIGRQIGRVILERARRLQNPFLWNEKRGRGMRVYHDIVDWLGGLPYEVAHEDAVVRFARQRGLILDRISLAPEGGCSSYVFSHAGDVGNP